MNCTHLKPDELKQTWAWFASALVIIPAFVYFCFQIRAVYLHGYFDLPIFMQAVIGHFTSGEIYRRGEDLVSLYKPGAIVFKFPTPYLFPFVTGFDGKGFNVNTFSQGFTGVALMLYASTIVFSIRQVFIAVPGSVSNSRRFVFLSGAIVFACLYVPFFRVLGGTGGENFIIAAAVLAFVCMRRWPWFSGFLFAYLAAAKLYPVFLLVYPLLKKQWSVLVYAAISFVLIVLCAIWFFGWDENIFYVKQILPVLLGEPVSEDWTEALNHSTGNFGIVKVFCTYGLLPNRFIVWLNVIRLPMIACICWLMLARARVRDVGWYDTLCFALVVTTMLVSLPNFFYSYLILLIFPIIVLGGFLFEKRFYGLLALFLLSVSCLLVDDGWLLPIVQQNHIMDPVGEMATIMQQEVSQHGPLYYVFMHFPLAFALIMMGKATQFMTVFVWLSLFLALLSLRHPAARFQQR
ncbi:MAG TPA: glycosyltransferase family 87 protein [Pseudomonadales bacterium]|nr:glycosyltransferase family 87 protein [Pseudomonadales bacterium]